MEANSSTFSTSSGPTKNSNDNNITIDYCAMAAEISRREHGVIPYKFAKGCYEMFPFDTRTRDDTVRNVRANLESFYVFYDIARKLGELIAQLQDPHTAYKSMCYQQFMFIQPMSTYGVFEEGRQQVKVGMVLNKLDPRLSSALVDCEVTHIDGRPAFDVIRDFARTKPYSKDQGVRINKSFSYLGHDKTGSPYDRYSLGTFAQRTAIPSNATIEYRINCRSKIDLETHLDHHTFSSSTSPPPPVETTLELSWSALDATMVPYNDVVSYREQFCMHDSTQTVKKFVLDSAATDDFSTVKGRNPHKDHKKSTELYRGAYASFHLLSDGVTGVFRLGTESPNKLLKGDYPSFYDNIDNGFAELEGAGATKLIVDLQNNSGGIICWGRYVLQTLFPATVDSPYIYSLRASPLAQALAKATFDYDPEVPSPYEGLVDPRTGDEVTSDAWITPGSKLAGREGLFSRKVTDRFCRAVKDIKGDADNAMFEPEDIVLLTNGFCGSTCAVLALQLHERYGVRTVAVGGEHGQSMMFSSFPGGAVQANNTLWVKRMNKVLSVLPESMLTEELKASVPRQLPANGQLAFAFRQVMSASHPDQVSEYMRIPSEFRMDYTVARFRMPSVLWEDVRDDVWGGPLSSPDEEGEQAEDGEEGGGGEFVREQTEIVVVDDIVEDIMGAMESAAQEVDREDLEWLQRYEMYK
ncbi:hypothetical protein BGZ58_007586 [Dissophora ornata]|nr:hypothetical protein BGZ58_007586 [Dissophora ornata]